MSAKAIARLGDNTNILYRGGSSSHASRNGLYETGAYTAGSEYGSFTIGRPVSRLH